MLHIDQKWKNVILVVATTIGVYLSFKYLLPLVLPFLLAYMLVAAIMPIVNFMHRKFRVSKGVGAGGVLVLLMILMAFLLKFLITNIIKQIKRLIENLPAYLDYLSEKIDGICCSADGLFGFDDGYSRSIIDGNLTSFVEKMKNDLMPSVTERTMSVVIFMGILVGVFFIIFISVILIIKDLGKMKDNIRQTDFFYDIKKVYRKVADAGIAYLRAEIIIMSIIMLVCVVGLMIMKNEYALLIGILVAILDAFPVFGSGFVFVPWSIFNMIKGDFLEAAILITLYIITALIRQFLEPKLIGEKIGIMPLYTIVAMYVGLNLFGVLGFIAGPIGLVLIRAILEENLG